MASALQSALFILAPVSLVLTWGLVALTAAATWMLKWVSGWELSWLRQVSVAGAMVFSVVLGPATVAAYLILNRVAQGQGVMARAARELLRAEQRALKSGEALSRDG